MKFSFPSNKQKNVQQRQQQDRVILFVCVENAGRSQIAEGFFNQNMHQKATEQLVLEPDLFLKLTLSQFKQ
jgi:protein-tyrosine-phosphatase